MPGEESQRILSKLERFARRFDKYGPRIGWAAGGLLVGLGAGWWAGGFLSCSRSVNGCELRADSIEAAGTWFGAIGTVLAVLAAVHAFRVEERRKRDDQESALLSAREREKKFLEEAKRVRIACRVRHQQGGKVRGYDILVTNAADRASVFRLQGSDFAGQLNGAHELGGGKTVKTSRQNGRWQAPSKAPIADKASFERWCEERVTIMFSMNDRDWRRTGHGEPELIDRWEAEGPDSPDW